MLRVISRSYHSSNSNIGNLSILHKLWEKIHLNNPVKMNIVEVYREKELHTPFGISKQLYLDETKYVCNDKIADYDKIELIVDLYNKAGINYNKIPYLEVVRHIKVIKTD